MPTKSRHDLKIEKSRTDLETKRSLLRMFVGYGKLNLGGVFIQLKKDPTKFFCVVEFADKINKVQVISRGAISILDIDDFDIVTDKFHAVNNKAPHTIPTSEEYDAREIKNAECEAEWAKIKNA